MWWRKKEGEEGGREEKRERARAPVIEFCAEEGVLDV